MTRNTFDTEDGRLAAAEAAGRAVAHFQISAGHTTPQDWTKDDNPHAGAYSHLAAVGFTRFGCRQYALPFINAYRAEFVATEATEAKTTMDNDTRLYRAHEFADLNPFADQIRIKVTASTDEHTSQTKWLTISRDELDAIKAVLIRKTEG